VWLLRRGAEAFGGAGDDQGGGVAVDRGEAAGRLLHEEAGVEHGAAGAAVLIGDGDAEPAELGHLAVEVLVVMPGVVLGEFFALLGGAALTLAEVADRGDEVALLVGEIELHRAKPSDSRARISSPSAVPWHSEEPGAGLEPATPSLPWKCSTN